MLWVGVALGVLLGAARVAGAAWPDSARCVAAGEAVAGARAAAVAADAGDGDAAPAH